MVGIPTIYGDFPGDGFWHCYTHIDHHIEVSFDLRGVRSCVVLRKADVLMSRTESGLLQLVGLREKINRKIPYLMGKCHI